MTDTVARPRRPERPRVILISRRRRPEHHASLRPDSRSHKHVKLEIGNQSSKHSTGCVELKESNPRPRLQKRRCERASTDCAGQAASRVVWDVCRGLLRRTFAPIVIPIAISSPMPAQLPGQCSRRGFTLPGRGCQPRVYRRPRPALTGAGRPGRPRARPWGLPDVSPLDDLRSGDGVLGWRPELMRVITELIPGPTWTSTGIGCARPNGQNRAVKGPGVRHSADGWGGRGPVDSATWP